MGSRSNESDRWGGPQEPHSPERKQWKYAGVARAFRRAHGSAPYVMDFKGSLEASAEDDTLSKTARRIMDRLKLLEWGNLSDAPVDAMPAVEPTDPQPREFTHAEIAARMGISASTFSEGCSELRSKGYLTENSTSLNLSDRRAPRLAAHRAPRNSNDLNAESNSDSANSSPFVRFRATYYHTHPELVAEIERQRAEINRRETELRMERAKLRALDRKVLSAWRDHQRHVHAGNGDGRTLSESDLNSAADSIADSVGVDSLLQEELNRTPRIPNLTPSVENEANFTDISAATDVLIESVESSESQASRQAEISADLPAAFAAVSPKLVDLRALFPSEFLSDERLEWVDRLVVSLLGEDYPRKDLVDFVRARQRPGAPIRAGLVFDWEHGIAREVCRKKLQERMSLPSRKSAIAVCPHCSDTGLIGGKICATLRELRAVENPAFCGCEHGRVARDLYEVATNSRRTGK
jgi:hypothetical protein